nr:hypothetical protein [Rhizobium sullae]
MKAIRHRYVNGEQNNFNEIGMFTCAARSVEALSDTVGKIIALFKPQECADYFAAATYDPD